VLHVAPSVVHQPLDQPLKLCGAEVANLLQSAFPRGFRSAKPLTIDAGPLATIATYGKIIFRGKPVRPGGRGF
jgi:hypothetical protein